MWAEAPSLKGGMGGQSPSLESYSPYPKSPVPKGAPRLLRDKENADNMVKLV